MPMKNMEYTRNQLKLLWYLKRHGGSVSRPPNDLTPGNSLMRKLGAELDIRVQSVGTIIRQLEGMSLVIRHYHKGRPSAYASGENNPLMKVELVDPGMWLPELPPPLPLAAVLANENEEMYHRTIQIPTEERVIEMLLARVDELQEVVDKLHTIVTEQAAENETLKQQVERLTRPARRQLSDHLMERIDQRLRPEQREDLRHLHD